MEALASHGVPTVLFTQAADAAQRARFSDVRAIGLAGSSRSETPAWMDEHLTPALGLAEEPRRRHLPLQGLFDIRLQPDDRQHRPRDRHRANDSSRKPVVPLVVGAPQLKRYTAFGNLFAAYQGQTYRIDRHPVMARHPVTPMTRGRYSPASGQANRQDHRPGRSRDARGATMSMRASTPSSRGGARDRAVRRRRSSRRRASVGRQLARLPSRSRLFVVGSSGIEYALLSEWDARRPDPRRAALPEPGPVDRIAVVSGSCSADDGAPNPPCRGERLRRVSRSIRKRLAAGEEAPVERRDPRRASRASRKGEA